MRVNSGAGIASNIIYHAFGSVRALTTTSVQPVTGGTRTLTMSTSYRTDGVLSGINWSLSGSSGISNIGLVSQTFAYGVAGLLSERNDGSDALASHYYGYDALLRMTCETRGDTSSKDCSTASPNLARLFTYGDGQGPTSPPDVRLTSYVNGAGTAGSSYTSPSVETGAYSSGSGQVQQITRTGSNLVIGYDAIGRRSFDYQSSDAGKSRRDYTYLPNGQLGTVQGRTSATRWRKRKAWSISSR
jgi:hypothetical protein